MYDLNFYSLDLSLYLCLVFWLILSNPTLEMYLFFNGSSEFCIWVPFSVRLSKLDMDGPTKFGICVGCLNLQKQILEKHEEQLTSYIREEAWATIKLVSQFFCLRFYLDISWDTIKCLMTLLQDWRQLGHQLLFSIVINTYELWIKFLKKYLSKTESVKVLKYML